MTYADAVKELYYSLYGTNPTNYHTLLYRLIAKADKQNRALLRVVYALEVLVFEEWEHADDEKKFFEENGIKMPTRMLDSN